MIWRLISGITEICGALALFFSMNIVTREAEESFRPIDRSWAYVRRAIYAAVCLALFSQGVYGLVERPLSYGPGDALPQVVIVLGIVFFPLLRAFGVITQDRLVSGVDVVDRALDGLFKEGPNGKGEKQ